VGVGVNLLGALHTTSLHNGQLDPNWHGAGQFWAPYLEQLAGSTGVGVGVILVGVGVGQTQIACWMQAIPGGQSGMTYLQPIGVGDGVGVGQ